MLFSSVHRLRRFLASKYEFRLRVIRCPHDHDGIPEPGAALAFDQEVTRTHITQDVPLSSLVKLLAVITTTN